MKKLLFLFPFIIFGFSWPNPSPESHSPQNFQPETGDPPRLVVVISVDQMRYDYFERFLPNFSGGLKRLHEQGAVFTNAHQTHALTATAPGHASLATGCYPSSHGIIGNEYIDRKKLERFYSVTDEDFGIIGVDNSNLPGVSPRNMQRTTLGDWVKSGNSKSKVYAVALKDRASALMAGHNADMAFWFDDLTTKFISSDFYKRPYPGWADRFVGKDLFADKIKTGWNPKYPEEVYSTSRADDFAREAGIFLPTFPHNKNRMMPRTPPSKRDGLMMWLTPLGDELTLEFAKVLIARESLGADQHMDVLFIGCSAADAIGHHFGPMSREVEDYYYHLDYYLGRFFSFLDKKIGRNGYVVALSADHGVQPMPEQLIDKGIPARRVIHYEFSESIHLVNSRLKRDMNFKEPVIISSNKYGVSLDFSEAKRRGITALSLRQRVAKALKSIDYVEETYTIDELKGESNKPYFQYFKNSFFPGRGHDILILFSKNTLVDSKPTGTSHGSPYPYDTHVPLIFMGPGITSGKYNKKVATVDLVPTMARILGVKPGRGVDGRVLFEVFE